MEAVVISTSGAQAVADAREAICAGKNVIILSKGFTVAEEIELKRKASSAKTILLGPGCGTSLLYGKGFGVWNSVKKGPIGLICTHGSGLRELSCLVDDVGVSHALGVGPRDMSQAVGATGTLSALKFLEKDENTDVIVVAGPAPSTSISRKIMDSIKNLRKPAVMCFLGATQLKSKKAPLAKTLEEAADFALSIHRGEEPRLGTYTLESEHEIVIEQERAKLGYGQRYVRGLYSGWMLCTEAQIVLQDLIGTVRSNVPLKPRLRLPDPRSSRGHACIDIGALESPTQQPAVNLDGQRMRILKEARDWEIGTLVLDVVLGHGAHPDPSQVISEAVSEAKRIVEKNMGYLSVIASIAGTKGDPQDLTSQRRKLERAGVVIARSNASAARMAAAIVQRKSKI